MIVFDLKCENGHVFEAWFRTSASYETQKADGIVACPHCGSEAIEKAIMAPNVAAKANQKTDTKSAHLPADQRPPAMDESIADRIADGAELFGEAVDKLRKHVEENCEYVGEDFTEEARAMHYGEKEERGIYGEATAEERDELADEGIDVFSLSMAKSSSKVEN